MATNAEQNQLKQANQNDQPSTGASTQQGPSTSRVASYSSGATPAAQGSGRFTNLKKYVNANQGAGNQLGSKITNTIDKNVDKTNKEATSQASNVADAIQSERDRLSEGNQFNQQLQDQSANGAQAINDDQATRDRFGNLLTNQNVSSNLLTQTQTAADKATSGLNAVNQQVQNLGNEQGRFALLQQAVKNPQYTQGQQRLDQLFLQTGNPNQLAQSQRDLQSKVNTTGKALTNQFTDLGSQIGEVGQQATDVSNLLRGTLGTETQNFVNAQAAQAQAQNDNNFRLNTLLNSYLTGGYNSNMTDDDKALIQNALSQAGLQSGQRTYNVLNDGKYANYLNDISGGVNSADVVDQNEYNRYNALFNLAGGTGTKQFTQAGSGGAVAGLQGDKLNTDITATRTALENQLNRDAQGSQSFFQAFSGDNANTGIIGPANASVTASLNADQNLLNLLNSYEAGNASAGSVGIKGGDAAIQYGGDSNTYYGSPTSTDSNVNRQIRDYLNTISDNKSGLQNQIWSDFLKELAASGYNNTLG